MLILKAGQGAYFQKDTETTGVIDG